jgi:mRNA interferase MazF
MLTSGDVVDLDLGLPAGSEAGFPRPAIIVTAQEILDRSPNVVQVVPLTSTIRGFRSEISIEPALSGLTHPSAAQCQHVRSVATARISGSRGNVGPVDLLRIRETLAIIFDLPG